ncbi:MAG: NlpC/P60 family protein [Alloprevotella sp.]|nr:MAG: NlpC/P60 family protein [Alloprevotella sp.]
MEKVSPRQRVIDLANAVQNYRKENAVAETALNNINSNASTALVDRLLNTAYSFLGVRYRSGQSGPDGFDCSGFTSYVYKQNNLSLTRSSRSQFTEGQPIAMGNDLRKGDLVFFGGRGARGGVGHVGIVTEVNREAGSFKFIHASISSGIKVDSSTDAYYSRRYVGARRIIQ